MGSSPREQAQGIKAKASGQVSCGPGLGESGTKAAALLSPPAGGQV